MKILHNKLKSLITLQAENEAEECQLDVALNNLRGFGFKVNKRKITGIFPDEKGTLEFEVVNED